MKILCFTMEFAPQLFGGLGSHVVGLVKELCSQGHNVDVVLNVADIYKNTRCWGIPDCPGLKVIPVHLPIYSNVFWIDQIFSNAFVMARMLERKVFDYDVIHCHSWIFFAVAMELKKIYKIPVVTTLHRLEAFREEIYQKMPHHHFVKEFDKWVCKESDHVICVSKDMKKQIFEISGRSSEISVIPNGVSIDNFPLQSDSSYTTPTKILFVGRLEPEKGIEILLEAVEAINSMGLNSSLTVVGAGTEQHIFQKKQFPFTVNYLGKLAPSDVEKIYAQHDLVVVPSLSEPFGIVAIEALASGLPIIASNVGGLVDIVVQPELGMLFEKGSISGLVQCLTSLILSAQYKRNAAMRRTYVQKNFSWESIAHTTTNVYKETIKKWFGK